MESMYADAAQYNQPPKYPVNMLCGGIDGAALGSDNDILSKMFAVVFATKGNKSCYVNPPVIPHTHFCPPIYIEREREWEREGMRERKRGRS